MAEPEARVDALREAIGKDITQGFYPADDAITRVASTICESLRITWEMAETIDQANPWVSKGEPNHDEVWDARNELLQSGYDALAALLTLAEIKR